MHIPDTIRKCVVFIALQMANGERRYVGTGFLIGRPIPNSERSFGYLITAKHVINKIKDKGLTKVFVRFNLKDGNFRLMETNIDSWYFHPTDSTIDVAVLRPIENNLPDQDDHLFFPLPRIATQSVIGSQQIGLGSEVFIVGLFAMPAGQKRNMPIIRVGNIAAMPEERAHTNFEHFDAYLIEARSTGGLSGSPVFAHCGEIRVHEGKLEIAKQGPLFFLLGLMHGHWDDLLPESDKAAIDVVSSQRVNMGIGIVVPIEKILEVINQPQIADKESKT